MGLNGEAAAAWVHALESGHYQQGQGLLRAHADEYCCLGVACDIAPKGAWVSYGSDTGISWAYVVDDQRRGDGHLVTQSRSDLPTAIKEHYGLSGERQGMLIALNDAGAPFDAIAALIRTWINQDAHAIEGNI